MSKTILGSFDGALTTYIRPYIEVTWTQNQTANTSTVTAKLYFHRYTNNYWTYNELTNSNGHSSTFRIGSSTLTQIRPFNLQKVAPPNRVLIWERTQTVSHNTNGAGSVYIGASGNTNVNPKTYNFGETITLPSIARETTITSASMANTLSPGVSNTLNLVVSRKHSSYTMDYEIYAGTTRISNLTGEGVKTTLTLSDTMVNKIIDTMSTVTSRTLQLRVTTRSGSTKIGNTQTKDFTVTLNTTNTRPTISGITVGINGKGQDNTIGKYVRTISRVDVSFNVNWGRAATEQSRSISLDSRTFGTANGTKYSGTSQVLNNSGTRTITLTATNSRKQSVSTTRTITVEAYSPPSITTFTGLRSTTTPTTVSLKRATSFSSLGGDNSQTVKIDKKVSGSTTWTNVWESTTTGSINNTTVSTGNAETLSYDFRFTVSDKFMTAAPSLISISTARTLMSFTRDLGVGIGKFHEQGTLDVGGDMYVNDNLIIRDASAGRNHTIGTSDSGHLNITTSSDVYIRGSRILLTSGNVRIWDSANSSSSNAIVESGSTGAQRWVRYYDGTQICYGVNVTQLTTAGTSGALYISSSYTLTFVQSFTSNPSVQLTGRGSASTWLTAGSAGNASINVSALSTATGRTTQLCYIAIGRWK